MGTSPESTKLYPEPEYAVDPKRFHPAAIDALATWLMQTFNLPGPPNIGIVRHIVEHPETGIPRFVKERTGDQQLGQSRLAAINRHISAVKELKETAIRRALAAIDRQEKIPQRTGLEPILTVSVGEEHPSLHEWYRDQFQTALVMIGAAPGQAEQTLDQLCSGLDTRYRDAFREAAAKALPVIHTAAEQDLGAPLIADRGQHVLNRNFFMPHGLLATIDQARLFQTAYREQERDKESSPRDFFLLHRLYDELTFASPVGNLSVLHTVNVVPGNLKRIFQYNVLNEYVHIDYDGLRFQLMMFFGFALRKLKLDGDYRETRATKQYHKAMWSRYKSRDFIPKLTDGIDLASHLAIRKLQDEPLFIAFYTSVLCEELRHALDNQCLGEVAGDVEKSLPKMRTEIFLDSSKLRAGFLDNAPKGVIKQHMLLQAFFEVVGKTTSAAVQPNPHDMLDEWQRDIEISRTRSNRIQTFEHDLESAEDVLTGADAKSWHHSLGAKISTTFLGNHLGLLKGKTGLQESYDHMELSDALVKMHRIPQRQLRLAIRDMMKPELMHAVDCKPFAKITDSGELEPQ